MSAKRFCDICEAPAIDYRAVGLTDYRRIATVEGRVCDVRVGATFGFVDHPAGFGGPPDLCRACVVELLAGLVRQAEGALR